MYLWIYHFNVDLKMLAYIIHLYMTKNDLTHIHYLEFFLWHWTFLITYGPNSSKGSYEEVKICLYEIDYYFFWLMNNINIQTIFFAIKVTEGNLF